MPNAFSQLSNPLPLRHSLFVNQEKGGGRPSPAPSWAIDATTLLVVFVVVGIQLVRVVVDIVLFLRLVGISVTVPRPAHLLCRPLGRMSCTRRISNLKETGQNVGLNFSEGVGTRRRS